MGTTLRQRMAFLFIRLFSSLELYPTYPRLLNTLMPPQMTCVNECSHQLLPLLYRMYGYVISRVEVKK